MYGMISQYIPNIFMHILHVIFSVPSVCRKEGVSKVSSKRERCILPVNEFGNSI